MPGREKSCSIQDKMTKPRARKNLGGRPQITTQNGFPFGWQEIILQLASKGCSEVEMRAHLCMMGGTFNHNTWIALKNRDEEFSETIQKAKVLSEAWWINKARTSLKSKTFQTGCWYACMKNMFKWRDKPQEIPDERLIDTELEFYDVPKKGKLPSRMEKFIQY